ncbi:trans-sulfuration enzyme family protein [Vibrio caribbeanicus]|uniref:Putative Cys/Met metabolism pyridoxal-phosphate-dependent enzyme n=1 Tax=Vibrio caribbeanicus ATCC BAA-2122 TaxID=796620 RepID=E3BHQ2_9VIBR|nr:PLP-dependent transferase [Vibrio caribbeanicus]EFP97341.1 putative Cys/Met metabolism pyridoxal-phosphate-dependent enzyme [Vibrio caribbeanicus ATCC BAA-2122]
MNTNKQLSPLRNSTQHSDAMTLANEQAIHFGIDPETEYGRSLVDLATTLYTANTKTHDLWAITMEGLEGLDKSDRIAWFNAKRFLSFQLAKILDNLQNPMRATYQSIATNNGHFAAKGAYPIFDNVAAIFSASPVITRTATYLFACTEWVEDAFNGREPLHEIYSRLLNPTSISLANHIVDIEAGEYANQYLAWNFNSGMAAIDGLLSHTLGREDIVIASRNIYGGSYQLLHDWYRKSSNLDVAIEWVDGYEADIFARAIDDAMVKYKDRIDSGKQIYVYLESPCNPHGYVLDVAGISRAAHEKNCMVMVDTTVGTPFLHPVLKRENAIERPDFVIHSYTKDLAGTGTTTAGVVIGRNEEMFIPKGDSTSYTLPNGKERTRNWDETLFWNVYYVKGAFLDADKAFEVLNGMKTFELRVLNKTINTLTLARVFDAHPDINVSCPGLETSPNYHVLKENMHLSLPASLFTIDMEGTAERAPITPSVYKQFFDMLEPAIGMQVSLGQTNTVALCPAMTTHSEMSSEAQLEAGIKPTTMRIAVGLEDPRMFLAHILNASKLTIDVKHPEFSSLFPSAEKIDEIYRSTYLEVHHKFLTSTPSFEQLTK